MKIVFFGTPDYVLPVLNAVHREYKQKDGTSPIAAVVTASPKPVGRTKILTYSAIDDWAHKRGIPKFFNPREIISEEIKADLGILASYGGIIPKEVLEYFPLGVINIHPSLLPKLRGASPIQATIASGETMTGATIIKLDEKIDHGPIISQFKEEVNPTDTLVSLRGRLFERSAEVLLEALPAYIKGKINLKPQDDTKATFTQQISKSDGFIPPNVVAKALDGKSFKRKYKFAFADNSYELTPDRILAIKKALTPWPGIWTTVKLSKESEEKRLKIGKTHIKDGKLVLEEVQIEGKNPVTWDQFRQGYQGYRF